MKNIIKKSSRLERRLKANGFHRLIFLAFILGTIFLNSCVSYKNTILIREKKPTPAFDSLTRFSIITPDYKLQPKDVLAIYISSFRPEISNFFNADKLGSFPVQDNGFVYLPIVDSIKAADLTIDLLRSNLRAAVRKYAADAYVSVNLTSFNVTVLGEVATPGIKVIARDRITIFEVLGMAGGISDFGDRKKVKVIRKSEDGVKIGMIDITNEDILASHYYYLLPGDVIYVQPMKEKTLVFNARTISIFVAFATVVYVVNVILNRVP